MPHAFTGLEGRRWGTMSLSQMLQHCQKQIEIARRIEPTKPMYPKPIQWLVKVTFGFYVPWPKNLIIAKEMIVADCPNFS